MIKQKFNVYKMTCSACSSHVNKAIGNLDGVKSVSVNLLSASMVVEYDEGVLNDQIIIKQVIKEGYEAKLFTNKINYEEKNKVMLHKVVISFSFLIPLVYICMGHLLHLPLPTIFTEIKYGLIFSLTQVILLIPIVIINFHYISSGIKKLIKLKPNMDTLVMLSTLASIIFGIINTILMIIYINEDNHHLAKKYHMQLYFETAGTILCLVSFGKYLESKSRRKTSEAIDKLINLAPKSAIVIENNEEIMKNINDIKIGDLIVIKPGMSIAVDGVIVSGSSTIDESYLTGESIPVYKSVGDKVLSATINQNGAFIFKATTINEDSTINEIVKLVEEASNSKAPIAALADKISLVFVPIVIVISLLSFIIWFLVSKDIEFSFSFSISVLVIACPCALGLATPLSIMVGTYKAAELKVLVRSAEALQIACNINTIVLDKTGTITKGKPSVTDILCYNGLDERKLLQIAYALENNASHPLALSIIEYAASNNIKLLQATNFNNVGGKGINAYIDNKLYYAGNINYLLEQNIDVDGYENIIDRFSQEGKTPLLFSDASNLIGIICVIDEIKESSITAIKKFKKLNLEVIMLTGDNEICANATAKKVGIEKVYAKVLPNQKQEIILELQKNNKLVCMIGDGINDSIALTSADVGMAIGSGSDIANLSADIILLKDDLTSAYEALNLSKTVIKNVKTNLFWAFFYNIISLPIAAGVLYPLFKIHLSATIAALAMSLSSVCVALNALRLMKYKSQKKEEINMNKVVKVEKMMCGHCVNSVKKALFELSGVKDVIIDLKKKRVEVIFDSIILDDDIIYDKIISAGYIPSTYEDKKRLFFLKK